MGKKASEKAKDTMDVVMEWCQDHGMKITKPEPTDNKEAAVFDLYQRLVGHFEREDGA